MDDQQREPSASASLEPNIRTLRQHESLNHLNTLLRKAKDLEDGYRLAVQCIDPERFSKVILLITEANGKHHDPGERSPMVHALADLSDDQGSSLRIRPMYVWDDGIVRSFTDLLSEMGKLNLLKSLTHEVSNKGFPLDRVMRGEELVMVREMLSEDQVQSLSSHLFDLLDVTGEIAMFPIMSKMDHAGRQQELDYYGVFVAEKTEELMDEDDWDYLREYSNIVGLGLENIHLLENLTRTIQELKEEKSFNDDIILRMSHEINTPITSIRILNDCIIGTIQQLLGSEAGITPENELDLLDILDSAKHIIINSSRLETLSKKLHNSLLVQYGNLELDTQEIDVADGVDKLLKQMRHFIGEHQAEVRNNLHDSDLPSIVTDPYSLLAVLEIIIENAIIYMPHSSDAEERQPEIDIKGKVEGEKLILSVSDNGRGFEEKDLKRIFKRLYRLTRIEHHKERPGLGLPTAKDILGLLNGEIIPHSEVGKGSRFDIILPLVHTG